MHICEYDDEFFYGILYRLNGSFMNRIAAFRSMFNAGYQFVGLKPEATFCGVIKIKNVQIFISQMHR